MTPKTYPPEERFWPKVNKDGPISALGSRCWLWTAQIQDNGYGKFWDGQRPVLAHRFAYGMVDPDKEVDHLCHVRHCVNPEHLEAKSHKKNVQNRFGAQVNSRTGVRGVSIRSGRYRAQVAHDGKNLHIGMFDTLEEAACAVQAKREELYELRTL